ncbi:MAG: DUF4331 domain-containing protein [Sulfurifustis sp.]
MKLSKLSAALVAAALVALPGIGAHASSHREAPFITETPKVDGTDFYMFMSYESGRQDYVTLIADYHPLQDAYGGPNYFSMDPDALYEIHVDNNGDAVEDITFQFNFSTELKDIKLPIGGKQVSIPLIQAGTVAPSDTSSLNQIEKFRVTVVRGDRRKGSHTTVTNRDATPFVPAGASSFVKPVDNIGNKTIADYAAYAANHIYTINVPGCSQPGRMFVGQRKEPFVVNLGETFDLVNFNPLGPENAEANTIANKNITSLILELHKSCLANGSEPVIGAWTTASLRQARLLRTKPSFDTPALEGGPWAQVSRLGMPLVNEVVIGLKDKDKFNASEPKDDAQFADYVTNPTLPALIELLFPSAPAPNNFPRGDLVAAFLTGINIDGVANLNKPAGVKAAEMMRLNTSIAPVAKGAQSRLGALGGDLAGFPNGRRPGDDVVDIELRVAMGALCVAFPGKFGCVASNAPAGGAPITDGAFISDQDFDAAFPYLRTPVPGSPNSTP